MNKGILARQIRQNEEKRREERRQQEQLKKEYNDELNRIAMERASSGPMNYLPSILVGLFFLAFPLGQEKIDWLIVSVTFIVNVIPLVALYSPSSWMNMFQMCLINLVVLHYAPFLYDAPDLVHQVRPAYFALFIGFNVLLSMSLYLFYVKDRQESTLKKKRKKTDSLDYDLLKFKLDVQRATRIDTSCCIILLTNLIALVLSGIIPIGVVIQSLATLRRLIL